MTYDPRGWQQSPQYPPPPPYAPPPQQRAPYPPPGWQPPQPSRRKTIPAWVWLVAALAAGAVIAVAAMVVSRSLGGSAGTGYNDPAYLAQSVKQQADGNLAKDDPGVTVTRAQCVHAAGTSYQCVTYFSDGSSSAWSATVAADGSSYVASRVP